MGHGAICPQNVIMDSLGGIKLKGFENAFFEYKKGAEESEYFRTSQSDISVCDQSNVQFRKKRLCIASSFEK